MAQRDKKEEPTELRAPEITLCSNNCGFPGNPATQNLCQSCFSAATASMSSANRCSSCRKRVGLTGFRCRCGELFCGAHRYSDRHGCSYDYKGAARDAIARENPVVRAAKIVRF